MWGCSSAAPWIVGAPTTLIANMPALNMDARLICMWGGVIRILVPGQFTVMV
ncbi:MAG: hypothetical protein CSB33_02935 [Desulfobacterales bacterium]|nr:MAG: hypothetical protein CSB33_02935 [Desulfobacterales bacterium]